MKTKTYWTKNKFTGEETGPFSFKEIATLIWQGDLNRHDFVKSSDADQWVKAGSLLEEIFLKVEARKRTESEGRGFASVPQVVENKSKPKGKARVNAAGEQSSPNENQPRRFGRITPLVLIFGSLGPSPYSGFWLMKLTINVLIVFGIIGLVSSLWEFVSVASSNPLNDNPLVQGLPGQIGGEADWVLRLRNNLMFYGLFLQIVWIVVLIFFRNIIDWLIDMEDHANAIRQQTIN